MVEGNYLIYSCLIILGFIKLPVDELVTLERKVKQDLRALLVLIKRHAREEAIIKLLSGDLRAIMKIKSRLIFTKDACIVIVEYLCNGIEERALTKARYSELSLDLAMYIF